MNETKSLQAELLPAVGRKCGSRADYARYRGVSRAAVTRAAAAGRIVEHVLPDGRRLVDFVATDATWPRHDDAPPATPTASPASADSREEARQARIAADRMRALDYKQRMEIRAGQLVSREDVERGIDAAAEAIRHAVYGIADRVAPRLGRFLDSREAEHAFLMALDQAADEALGIAADTLEGLRQSLPERHDLDDTSDPAHEAHADD